MNLVRGDVTTLAQVPPGDCVRVDTIVFGALRSLCGDIGLREGDDVLCWAETQGTLILQTAEGRIVCLARDWARHIRVAPNEINRADSVPVPSAM
jgi:hypothetical protein